MTDIQQLRKVTRGYPYLQGLKVVPIGLLLLLTASFSIDWWPWEGWEFLPFAIAGIAAVAAMVWISRYYERRFGRVSPTPTQFRRDAVGTAIAAIALAGGLLVDVTVVPPVSVFGLSLAAVLIWYWSWSGGPRPYHWLLAGALAVVALLPLASTWFDIDLVDKGDAAFTLVLAAAGAVYVAAGLLDHAHLVRSIGPAPEERDVHAA